MVPIGSLKHDSKILCKKIAKLCKGLPVDETMMVTENRNSSN